MDMDDADGNESDDNAEPPEVQDIPPGIRWNKFQSYYKGQSLGIAHEYFRKYVVYWAKKEMEDAESRGEVAIIDNCLLPRGLKWAEFCTYFTAHTVEVCQVRAFFAATSVPLFWLFERRCLEFALILG
jgi:rubredoxin